MQEDVELKAFRPRSSFCGYLSSFLFWRSTGKYNEDVIFHVFYLTLRLAIDARLHQKTVIQGESAPWMRAAKITIEINNFLLNLSLASIARRNVK